MLKIIHARGISDRGIEEEKTVFIDQGKFVAPNEETTECEIIDAHGAYLCPGFIDIHTHGMMGYDFMDCTEEAIDNIARAHLMQGATTIIPTSLAGSREATLKFLQVYSETEKCQEGRADMPCVHLEGPYFAASQKGAQPEKYLRTPDPEEYGEILEKYGSLIGRWSAASELEGMEAFARECRRHQILVAYAHSDADAQQAMEANRWGFSHYTHLYSCMSSVHRRQGRRYGGLVESAYLMEDTTAELITDGMHLPPELAELAYRCKGADKVCLITDSMRAAGLPEGEYILGAKDSDHKVIVRGGVAWMPDFESFAGSVSSMSQVVRIAVQRCNIPLRDAVKMATKTPAEIMGLTNKGRIEPGYDADCLLLNDDLRPILILKNGQLVLDKRED